MNGTPAATCRRLARWRKLTAARSAELAGQNNSHSASRGCGPSSTNLAIRAASFAESFTDSRPAICQEGAPSRRTIGEGS